MPQPKSVSLSTGQAVALPLDTRAQITGVVLPGDLARARERLPDGLAPVRVAPDRAGLVLLSVDYRRIGDDAMAPYDEVGVFLAATPSGGPVPEFGALRLGLGLGVGAYTVALPVTTEPARALGEVWGYPKTVRDISITRSEGRRRTTVGDADDPDIELDLPFAPRFVGTVGAASFTDGDGLRRQPLTLRGAFGVHPFAGRVSAGEGRLAELLGDLDPGRPLASLSFDGRFVIDPNERLVP